MACGVGCVVVAAALMLLDVVCVAPSAVCGRGAPVRGGGGAGAVVWWCVCVCVCRG